MTEDSETTALGQAWLDALAKEEKKAEVSEPLIEDFDKPILREATKPVILARRKTVHIAPPGIQLAKESKRVDESKLIYQAEKLGNSWSKWINDAGLNSWQRLDPKTVSAWTSIAVRMQEIEQPLRSRLFGQIASGMGIVEDHIRNGLKSDDNKISYMFGGIDSNRKHLIIGINRLSIDMHSVPSGGFFLASIAHLSEFEVTDSPLKLLRSGLAEQLETAGQLSLPDTFLVTSNWISKTEVKDYFFEKSSK